MLDQKDKKASYTCNCAKNGKVSNLTRKKTLYKIILTNPIGIKALKLTDLSIKAVRREIHGEYRHKRGIATYRA